MAETNRVVTEITIDARGSAAGSADYVRAMAVAQAAVDRLMDREAKLAAGAGKATDMLMVQSASIGRVAASWDRLRASIDPVTRAEVAAARELNRAMLTADSAVKRGVTSQQDAARVISALRQKQIVDIDAVRQAQQRLNSTMADTPVIAANQNRRGSVNQFNTSNVAAQFQDIAVTSAMGMSPLQIALQQGTQLSAVLGQQGAAGAARTLGAALLSIVSPVSLITIGLVGAAAAAIQYFSKSKAETKSLDDVLKEHEKAIGRVRDLWGEAADERSKYGRESTGAVTFGLENNLAELVKRLRDANKTTMFGGGDIGEAVTAAINKNMDLTGLGAREFRGTTLFKTLQIDFEALQKATIQGRPDVLGLIKHLEEIGQTSSNAGIKAIAADAIAALAPFKDLAEAIQAADRELKRLFNDRGPNGMLLSRGQTNRDDMGNLALFEAQEAIAAARRRAAAQAQLESLLARSPAEKAAAARSAAGAQYNDNESAAARADRIDIAGKLALAEAEKALAEARRDRARSLEETLASQQLELGLIGQTVGEVARLRMEYDLTSKLREEAARNGIEADQKEIDLIKQKAAEYGRYAEEIARTNLLREVQFERDQLFRSAGDQSIASRLRGAGLPVDLNSDIARAIRENQRIEELRAGIRGFFDDFLAGLMQGDSFGKALGNAILNALNRVLDKVLDNLVKSIVNSLVGGATGGGSGSGIVGAILGAIGLGGNSGGSSGADPWGALRDVTSGSNVSRLFSPANSNQDMSIFRQAISAIESAGSGGYSALGPWTKGDRAYGAYQVMGANIPSWTKQALGNSMTPSQFLADPRAQDSVFDHYFGKSLSKYGNPQDAASVWFTGKPLSGGAGAKDVLGTSGSVYVDKFNAQLDKLGGTADKATGGIGKLGSAGANATQGLQQAAGSLAGLSQQIQTFMASAQGGGSSWFQNLAGMFGGAGGAFSFMGGISPLATADILSGSWGLFHDGGVAGCATRFRAGVDPRIFNGAPRYHNGTPGAGLGPDEVPAILRRGEPVFKSFAHARQVVGGGNKVNININNLGGASVQAEAREEADGTTSIDIVVDRVVADKLSRRGTAANSVLRTQYGAREALKRR
ncbi:tail length tape measure protein [Aminobacter aminovorans]|uniref:Prophage tail length tape measure protein n=1 Tax=Aminobacter aminovorans TaxID=83263 RepID=A0A380WLY7_AMIAI|nr:phage tail length tape measure family protein [Aminobacter aminovorans]TCS27590.1 tail length tape measure protein [Aminobacter aminovorans]SUU89997.1 Prophage tail length tape measure protein [Aminobacter aminovorans]